MSWKILGKEFDRVDGVAKVTGTAKYAAEFHVPGLSHGYLVMSKIARGSIASIDTSRAEKSPGVLRVFTHLNTPASKDGGKNKQFKALQSADVRFNAQPVALVVAENFEQAREAAALVQVTYRKQQPRTLLEDRLSEAVPASPNGPAGKLTKTVGDPSTAYATAEVTFEGEYTIPIEHHNPMEPHAAVAYWQGDKLKIFDKTQHVYNVRSHLAEAMGVPEESVEVISPYVGGAFGCSIEPNYYPALTAMAARELQRPVKLVYTRRQMFTGHGYRPYTRQRIRLAADKSGKLQAMLHEAINNSSTIEPERGDSTVRFAMNLYACPNMSTDQKVVALDLGTPCAMRAPGAVSGAFALESALDELSYKLGIDPLELRLVNYADSDPETGRPFSSKALRDCYTQAAERFGWKARKPEPRSMREGRELIGYGMSTGLWGASFRPASAKIVWNVNGKALVTSATSDIGPGTYTVMTMIAAEYLGLTVDDVTFELGDTKMPRAPVQGGSFTTASVGSAIHGAALALKEKLLTLAQRQASSPLRESKADDVVLSDGRLRRLDKAAVGQSVSAILKSAGLQDISQEFTAEPSEERAKFSTLAHGAQFVEVRVDEQLGTVRVTRAVEATACGRILNPKTSHSQEIGGVVWGIGMALTEATEVDHRYGRIMNSSLADYHVPCAADVHEVVTDFVEEDDPIVNPLGVKGMGELGMVGIPAAISNAIYHATGKRVRDLPITPDKLL